MNKGIGRMEKIFFGLCLCWLSAFTSAALAQMSGTDIRGASIGQDWQAVDLQGQPVSPESYRGKLTLFYFGFLHCPDVCPSTLASLSELFSLLSPEQRSQLRVVFVTLDPQRDSAEHLASYLASFHAGFEGVTGSPKQIAEIARAFRVRYRQVLVGNSGDYSIEHSSLLFMFSKQATPLAMYYSDVPVEVLVQDIVRALNP